MLYLHRAIAEAQWLQSCSRAVFGNTLIAPLRIRSNGLSFYRFGGYRSLTDDLGRAGIIKERSKFKAFASSFIRAQPLFDFIDIGARKERADRKINGE